MGVGGPITEAGKAVSSRNAQRHGLLSEAPVTTACETLDDWQAHRRSVLAELQPDGQSQVCLVERIAHLQWRLRRVAVAEVAAIESGRKDVQRYKPENARADAWPLFNALSKLETLARYEAHLSRELARTMKALQELRRRPAEHIENCETNSPLPEGGSPSTAASPASPASPAPARVPTMAGGACATPLTTTTSLWNLPAPLENVLPKEQTWNRRTGTWPVLGGISRSSPGSARPKP